MLSALNRGAARTAGALIAFLGTMAFLSSGNPIGFAFVFVGPTLAILVHELGHAFAAARFGMAVHEISVGPLVWRTKVKRIGFGKKILGADVGGYVLYDDSRGRYLSRTTHALIAAAGPLANFIAAFAAYSACLVLPDSLATRLLIGFAFASFAAFIVSAWPHKLLSGRANDALEILRDLRVDRPARPSPKPARSPWQAS